MCSAAAAFEVDERVSVRVIVSYPVFNLETIDWLESSVTFQWRYNELTVRLAVPAHAF